MDWGNQPWARRFFFDIAQRYAGLDAKNDPLARIDEVVPWEDFRPRIEAAWRKPTEERGSPAGRKPWDAVVMFKAIVLCELYNLSGRPSGVPASRPPLVHAVLGVRSRGQGSRRQDGVALPGTVGAGGRDRDVVRGFRRLSGAAGLLGDGRPDHRRLDRAGAQTAQHGDDNARIEEGETPEGWENQPAKRSQKETDARWNKKHGKSHYGYKNHVNVDRRHKLMRRYRVTDAAVHDSQIVDDILDPDNTASDVWADSAYRSAEIEAKLEEKGLKSRIHRKGYRNKPLSEREKRGNTTRSKVRARVEHVFGAQSNDMGGTLVRSIGMVRARARIGLKNLAYNMRRLVQLERLATAPT